MQRILKEFDLLSLKRGDTMQLNYAIVFSKEEETKINEIIFKHELNDLLAQMVRDIAINLRNTPNYELKDILPTALYFYWSSFTEEETGISMIKKECKRCKNLVEPIVDCCPICGGVSLRLTFKEWRGRLVSDAFLSAKVSDPMCD